MPWPIVGRFRLEETERPRPFLRDRKHRASDIGSSISTLSISPLLQPHELLFPIRSSPGYLR
jgi:hypothetical protein